MPAVAEALAAGRPLAEVPALRLRDAGRLDRDARPRRPDGPRRRAAAGPRPRRTRPQPLPLPALQARLARRDGPRLPLPLQLLLGLAALRALVPRAVDRRRRRGHRRRSATPSSSPTTSSGTTRSAASSSREALKTRGVRKRWILVQTRTDLVCRHPELLEAWRPLAKDFDIFFGLEAASDAGLASVTKDAGGRLVDRGGADRPLDRLRRHRELPRRSRLGRVAVPGALGLRREERVPARRLHDPDAAARHGALPEARRRSSKVSPGSSTTCTTCCGSRAWARSASSSSTPRPGAARS